VVSEQRLLGLASSKSSLLGIFTPNFFWQGFKIGNFCSAKREYWGTLCQNCSIWFAIFWELCSVEIRVFGCSRIQCLTGDLGKNVISRSRNIQIEFHLWYWLGYRLKFPWCEFKVGIENINLEKSLQIRSTELVHNQVILEILPYLSLGKSNLGLTYGVGKKTH